MRRHHAEPDAARNLDAENKRLQQFAAGHRTQPGQCEQSRRDRRHRQTPVDARPGVSHNLVELRFRLLEGRRQHTGLTQALRLALLGKHFVTSPGVAQIGREPPQVELISVGEDIDCSNRGIQRQIIVDDARELLADLALQQNRCSGRHCKQQEKAKGQCHNLAA